MLFLFEIAKVLSVTSGYENSGSFMTIWNIYDMSTVIIEIDGNSCVKLWSNTTSTTCDTLLLATLNLADETTDRCGYIN